jgi:hypothetical protein
MIEQQLLRRVRDRTGVPGHGARGPHVLAERHDVAGGVEPPRVPPVAASTIHVVRSRTSITCVALSAASGTSAVALLPAARANRSRQ